MLKLSNDLKSSANFDINFSGSTFVSVLKIEEKLWCANVGDSRAILARQLDDMNTKGSHWMSIGLSRDHKPDEPDEEERILN